MNASADPAPEVIRKTFRAELVRAVASGLGETGLATFAILIAVREFESGPMAKAILLGSFAVGLIGSLFVVPFSRRTGWPVNRLAAVISLVGAAGFLLATLLSHREWGFISGMCLGFIAMALPLPLQTQYLRANYPTRRRGHLFSQTLLVRAAATIGFAAAGGWMLDIRFDWFRWLLLAFAVAGIISAFCFWSVPPMVLRDDPENGVHPGARIKVFRAMRWLKRDREFRQVILSAMAMGMGVLTANALRVDYLVNPVHGLSYEAKWVAIISSILPSVLRVASTTWWGGWFDRANLFRIRIAVNLLFGLGIALYFSTHWLWLIMLGSALLGFARGGGEILWNLWVTKLAAPENVGEYMSVHTFFTGIRALMAPFIGFYLVEIGSIGILLGFSLTFVVVSVSLLWQLLPGSEAEQSVERE